MTDKEFPPTLDQIFKCSAPTQKLKKILKPKKWKWKVEKVCPQPYIYMVHCMEESSQKQKPDRWRVAWTYPFKAEHSQKSNSDLQLTKA